MRKTYEKKEKKKHSHSPDNLFDKFFECRAFVQLARHINAPGIHVYEGRGAYC